MNIRLPTREEIHSAFAQGEAAVVELVLGIGQQMEELAGHAADVHRQQAAVATDAVVFMDCLLYTSRCV